MRQLRSILATLAVFVLVILAACDPPVPAGGEPGGPCVDGPAGPDQCRGDALCLHTAADPEGTVCAEPCAKRCDGGYCLEGLCLTACFADEDCLRGQACVDWGPGVCVWPIEPALVRRIEEAYL